MSDLVGNPEDRFSRVAAHILHDQIYMSNLLDFPTFDKLWEYLKYFTPIVLQLAKDQ